MKTRYTSHESTVGFVLRRKKKTRKGSSRGQLIRNIAQERMLLLYQSLDRLAIGQSELIQRYADLSRKIAMKSRTKLPRKWRYRICRGCKSVLQPGKNCRVRTRTRREKHVSVTCLKCGRITRYSISVKK